MFNKRLLKESRYKKHYIPITILHAVINSSFIVLTAALLALIVDGVFLKKYNLSEIKGYLILFLLSVASKFIFNFLIEVYIKNCSEDIKEEIKRKTFNLIISSNPYKVKTHSTGEFINLLTDGIEMITAYYSKYIPQVIAAILIPTVICISVAMVDRLSALIMLITYPIIPIFMLLIGYKTKELNEKQWKKLIILSSHFLDVLQGLSTLKSFGRSKIQEKKVFEVSENYRKSTMEVLKVTFLSSLVLELAATISTAVVAVNLGLRLVYAKISFLEAFFILVLTPDFYYPIRQLGLKFHSSLDGQVAIEKIEAIENALKEETKNTDILKGNLKIDDIKNFNIEVKNLSFVYEKKEALNSISFTINEGEKVALIGESGSGKSTLINVLSGFLKVEDGMVFIDGKDINHINMNTYLSNVVIVPQFPHIFNMSVEDNICLGNKCLCCEEISNICKNTKVDQLSGKFKEKCKTIIGEGEEVEISGGEKQRIAIARATVKNAEFIILDEPTSAMDSETEEVITELMKGYFKNKTVLISTHRLNTIKAVDKILVLEDGYLVEEGTHDELIHFKGKYYQFVESEKIR